jgi:hypothetical protein
MDLDTRQSGIAASAQLPDVTQNDLNEAVMRVVTQKNARVKPHGPISKPLIVQGGVTVHVLCYLSPHVTGLCI